MRKFFAVAMGSLVALVGFAGMANASATVDLIWIDISNVDTNGNPICLRPAQRNCPQMGTSISPAAISDAITLGVILTAGPGSILAAAIDVDFRSALPQLDVMGFRALATTKPKIYLPTLVPRGADLDAGLVQTLGASSFPGNSTGLGLPAGNTAYLGTVTFVQNALVSGNFEVAVGVQLGADGISDIIRLNGDNVSPTTTFNSAFLVNVPEPGALSLLVMGLSGMLLAGRGRRS